MPHSPNEESAVDDFVAALLRACDRRGGIVRTRKGIPFLICGRNQHPKHDACLWYFDDKSRLRIGVVQVVLDFLNG